MSETKEQFNLRLKKLCIPPAWKNVVISKDPTDYLQVTGHDTKGKIQYIYHPLFVALTDIEKYERLRLFCKWLPTIEKNINRDLLSKDEKLSMIALLFKILSKTYVRVGNKQYAKENKTYGLTTLQKRHVSLSGGLINIKFVGKKGVHQDISFEDKTCYTRLKKIIEKNDGPKTSHIFVYFNDSGEKTQIESNDMNEYLKSITGQEFTCKDFRTYYGNILFIEKLKETMGTDLSDKQIINDCYKEVAKFLGNTSAISKKAYVVPKIAEMFIENKRIFVGPSDKILLKILK